MSLTCVLCAALTCAVSLDGAVVLMVPLALALGEDFGVPVRPLLLGIIAVANASSIAVPQGNPTNLVLIARLHLSPTAFTAHMFLPGLARRRRCAPDRSRGSSAQRSRAPTARRATRSRRSPAPSATRRPRSLVAALVAWAATLLGIAPWWPFAAVVALAVALPRGRDWRSSCRGGSPSQVAALVIVVGGLGLRRAGAPGWPARPARGRRRPRRGRGDRPTTCPRACWAGALLAAPTGYAAIDRPCDRPARDPPGLRRHADRHGSRRRRRPRAAAALVPADRGRGAPLRHDAVLERPVSNFSGTAPCPGRDSNPHALTGSSF